MVEMIMPITVMVLLYFRRCDYSVALSMVAVLANKNVRFIIYVVSNHLFFQVVNVLSQAVDGAGWSLNISTNFTFMPSLGNWVPWFGGSGGGGRGGSGTDNHSPSLLPCSVHGVYGLSATTQSLRGESGGHSAA